MTMPNFLVIGAMKAGTTSLYRYLKQHPDIFMPPVKEPLFFSRETVLNWKGPDPRSCDLADLDGYRSLFAARPEKARGEATPIYLCDPRAPDEIHRYIPDAKLIVILRQPVDRAYSAYLMKRRQGWERLGFEEGLAAEPRRIEQQWGFGWHYAALGRYREQLERYYRCFNPARIKIVLFDDLRRDPRGVTQALFRFLEVDDSFEPDTSTPHNEAFLVRHPPIQRWVTRRSPLREQAKRFLPALSRPIWDRVRRAAITWNALPAPRLAPDVRAKLTHRWHDDILALEEVIDRDLSAWRER